MLPNELLVPSVGFDLVIEGLLGPLPRPPECDLGGQHCQNGIGKRLDLKAFRLDFEDGGMEIKVVSVPLMRKL